MEKELSQTKQCQVNLSQLQFLQDSLVNLNKILIDHVGSGKTTIILDLISQLPKNYKVVLLKNEFGNVQGIFPIIVSIVKWIVN